MLYNQCLVRKLPLVLFHVSDPAILLHIPENALIHNFSDSRKSRGTISYSLLTRASSAHMSPNPCAYGNQPRRARLVLKYAHTPIHLNYATSSVLVDLDSRFDFAVSILLNSLTPISESDLESKFLHLMDKTPETPT